MQLAQLQQKSMVPMSTSQPAVNSMQPPRNPSPRPGAQVGATPPAKVQPSSAIPQSVSSAIPHVALDCFGESYSAAQVSTGPVATDLNLIGVDDLEGVVGAEGEGEHHFGLGGDMDGLGLEQIMGGFDDDLF